MTITLSITVQSVSAALRATVTVIENVTVAGIVCGSRSNIKSNLKSESNSNGTCHIVDGFCVCPCKLNRLVMTAKYFVLTASVDTIQKSYRGTIVVTLCLGGYDSY